MGWSVPEELDGGEAGVAIEHGGEGEAVEEGPRAEDNLVLHLVAGALQLGAAPPDGLQLRGRGPRGSHAARRRGLAPRATAAAPDPDCSGGGGEGGGRQPRRARAQQRHFFGLIVSCVRARAAVESGGIRGERHRTPSRAFEAEAAPWVSHVTSLFGNHSLSRRPKHSLSVHTTASNWDSGIVQRRSCSTHVILSGIHLYRQYLPPKPESR